MTRRALKLFSGSAHPALAKAVADRLGIPVGLSRTVRFSNENLKVCLDESVRDADVFVLQPSCPPVSDGLVELLIMLDALRGASAGRITAVMPYFPYVRSDKKDEPRVSIAARLMADLVTTAGADRAICLDLHSPQVQGFFRVPVDQLSAVPMLIAHVRAQGELGDLVVVAPDAGEVKDAARHARRLGVPLAILDKRRTGDDERARAVHLIGDVAGKRCLIVDDEISTGGTAIEAATHLVAAGAKSVSVAVVHGVLVSDAPARLAAAPLAEVIVTDSLPVPEPKRGPRTTVLSIAPLLAEAIQRVHEGRSLADVGGPDALGRV